MAYNDCAYSIFRACRFRELSGKIDKKRQLANNHVDFSLEAQSQSSCQLNGGPEFAPGPVKTLVFTYLFQNSLPFLG